MGKIRLRQGGAVDKIPCLLAYELIRGGGAFFTFAVESFRAAGNARVAVRVGVSMEPLAYLRPGVGASRGDIRLLFACAGRRVQLVQTFIQAARACRLKPVIHTTDAAPWVAAGCVADKTHIIPPIESAEYIPHLLEIAEPIR